jgi:4-diphosphocytidyl-2-C-methyl-D-erythritol kinase
MKIRSLAKINLGLEVLGRRPDGYHDIRTLFQWVSLWDGLEFNERPAGGIGLGGSDPTVPWDDTNLISAAAKLIRERTPGAGGVDIFVAKNIPAGRGLGGGSSNAAATLLALNELWRAGLSRNELDELGKILGADVPYFLEGGLCLGEGRGDRLTPLPDLPPYSVVLAFPPFPISTASIYGGLDRASLTSEVKDSRIGGFLKTREIGFLENKLEDTIFRFYPQLKEYKSLFGSHGAELSLVTGSGSAVFGLFADKEKARRSFGEMQRRGAAVLAVTLSRAQGWEEIEAGVSPSGKAADFGSAIRGFESSRPSLSFKKG